jgi:succinate dehydrogenase / fumarate reductase flavoprotein subunit
VHGANRLGTNSLLDLVVFGKHAGLHAAEFSKHTNFAPLSMDPTAFAREQFDRLRNADGKENAYDIGNEMKKVMFDDVSLFRTERGMTEALEKVRQLRERYKHVRVSDTGRIFNTDLLNAWELGNMLELAEVVTVCALNRTESRGGHAREDYPKRDDDNWLKHSLIWQKDGKLELGSKPVVITQYQPKERTY